MKVLKFSAGLFGAFALLFGATSCKDDGPECCSFSDSYTENGITYKYTVEACDDGSVNTVYTADGETYKYESSWKDYFDSWGEVKDLIVDNYDGTCD